MELLICGLNVLFRMMAGVEMFEKVEQVGEGTYGCGDSPARDHHQPAPNAARFLQASLQSPTQGDG